MDEMDPLAPPRYWYGGGGSKSGHRRPGDHSHYGGVDNPRSHPPPRRAASKPRASSKPPMHAPAHKKPKSGDAGTKHIDQHPSYDRYYAKIVSFDSGAYTAVIALAKSPDQTIADVPVSRGIASGEVLAGRDAAVLFFDRGNNRDAMIVGVH